MSRSLIKDITRCCCYYGIETKRKISLLYAQTIPISPFSSSFFLLFLVLDWNLPLTLHVWLTCHGLDAKLTQKILVIHISFLLSPPGKIHQDNMMLFPAREEFGHLCCCCQEVSIETGFERKKSKNNLNILIMRSSCLRIALP